MYVFRKMAFLATYIVSAVWCFVLLVFGYGLWAMPLPFSTPAATVVASIIAICLLVYLPAFILSWPWRRHYPGLQKNLDRLFLGTATAGMALYGLKTMVTDPNIPVKVIGYLMLISLTLDGAYIFWKERHKLRDKLSALFYA